MQPEAWLLLQKLINSLGLGLTTACACIIGHSLQQPYEQDEIAGDRDSLTAEDDTEVIFGQVDDVNKPDSGFLNRDQKLCVRVNFWAQARARLRLQSLPARLLLGCDTAAKERASLKRNLTSLCQPGQSCMCTWLFGA